ncbi:hypothetical protein [Streptomyces sp. NPDC046870]|uniref:hypothetical protein n=1 Tax=Streptomyces sp. NPDC046870 TaxID=3155135 RepID=UPI0034560EEB
MRTAHHPQPRSRTSSRPTPHPQLDRRREDPPQPARQEAGPQITAGFRYIAHTPTLRQFTLAAVLAVVAFGFSESVLFAVADAGLHRPPAFLGVLSSLQGAGAIAAGRPPQ